MNNDNDAKIFELLFGHIFDQGQSAEATSRNASFDKETAMTAPDPKTPEQLKRERDSRVYNNTHHVSEVNKLPKDVRFWVLEQTSMTYDSGYGRHGQQDMCTSQLLNVIWFEDDEALEAWVLKAVEARKTYRIFRAEPVNTEIKTIFSIVK